MTKCLHQFRTISSVQPDITTGICVLCDAVKRWGNTHKRVILTIDNKTIPDESAKYGTPGVSKHRRKRKARRDRNADKARKQAQIPL